MDYSKIPYELRDLDQWVCCWDSSKVPMRAGVKQGASTVDPASWSSFDQACAAVDAEVYDYIGFVFNDNHIVGIDIDTGYEDGLLTPLCVDIIKSCRSYTEKSRSGRGVHIFVKGDLPFPGKNNQRGVEIYKDKRYFVTTGKQICFADLIENQAGIDYVLDKYFQETPKPAREALKFESLSKSTKIYTPKHEKPKKGAFRVSPEYPEISKGNRHLSMLSIAGQLWKQGYVVGELYKQLCKINQESCKPPLTQREIESICTSIQKYER